MKNIVHKLLLEFADISNGGKLNKIEVSVLKSLNNQGFKRSSPMNKILVYLVDELGFDTDEAKNLFSLFYNNYTSSGNYGELDDIDRGGIKRKVKSANYTARDLVKSKIPFTGSNTSGEWYRNSYVVKSYGWYPIFVYNEGQWYENAKRYSRSTGKQMGQLRPTPDTIELSIDELNDIIRK